MSPATSASVAILVILALGAGYTALQANSSSSSLSSQITSLENRPAITTTVTQTVTENQTTTETSSVTSSVTTTQSVTMTTTQTLTVTSTSTTSIYPVPDNVTVVVTPSGQFMNYAITAGSYSSSGSLGKSQTFSVSPVYQGETITISIDLSCPGSTGPSGSATLFVNGASVSVTDVACGGNTNGQISYVL